MPQSKPCPLLLSSRHERGFRVLSSKEMARKVFPGAPRQSAGLENSLSCPYKQHSHKNFPILCPP